jgi:GNAT superfamily N-acetyltransferase
MAPADVPAVYDLTVHAFRDLNARHGRPPDPAPRDVGPSHIRFHHLIATDPGGALVAERDGVLLGAALALVRDSVWGLSLLVVRPGTQSMGIGSALFSRALAYGDERAARGWIILASDDPRAIRAYARAGFTLQPAIAASGVLGERRPDWPAGVREGSAADLEMTAGVDRAIRGAARPQDLGASLAAGQRLLVVDGRGYAMLDGATVVTISARDDGAAADLLRAAAAAAAGDERLRVEYLTGDQGWAVDVAVELGLDIAPGGPVFVRGELGPLHPYVPSGAYL